MNPEDAIAHVMASADEVTLAHLYDPVKAREYYLRTRELKGRKKGIKAFPSGKEVLSQVPQAKMATPAKAVDNSARLKAEAKGRTAMLQQRLERLKEVLAGLVEQAKERSGVETKESPSKKAESKDTKAEPKTAAEKKEAAKKAKEDYEKNKNPESNASAQSIQNQIEAVQKQIADARANLQAAIARARQSKPTTPPKKSTPPKSLPPKSQSQTASKAVVTKQKGDSQNGR